MHPWLQLFDRLHQGVLFVSAPVIGDVAANVPNQAEKPVADADMQSPQRQLTRTLEFCEGCANSFSGCSVRRTKSLPPRP
jgi:hypothetical protein